MSLQPGQQELMYRAGKKSLAYIEADVAVFGAGRTVCQALQAFFDEGLHEEKRVVCASLGTERYANELGITVEGIDSLDEDYVYIDGADQIDPERNLIKGGFKNTGNPGIEGCMYREKRLTYNAGKFIVIVDDSKVVEYLGANGYGLPLEFRGPEEARVRRFVEEEFGIRNAQTRIGPDNEAFVTENGNYIFDIPFDGRHYDLPKLEGELDKEVFSSGIFAIRIPDVAIVAAPHGTRLIE